MIRQMRRTSSTSMWKMLSPVNSPGAPKGYYMTKIRSQEDLQPVYKVKNRGDMDCK